MSDARKAMEKALKEAFVPELKKRGFTGSLPHFRRTRPDRVDHLMVQFDRAGVNFVVEVARCGPGGTESLGGLGKGIPAEKLTLVYFPPQERLRLGSKPEAGLLHRWFEFESIADRARGASPKPYQHYLDLASSVVPFLDSQAEAWWNRP